MYEKHERSILRILNKQIALTAVNICGTDGTRRGNYFGGESIRRTEVEVGVNKNGKAAGNVSIANSTSAQCN